MTNAQMTNLLMTNAQMTNDYFNTIIFLAATPKGVTN